MSDPIIADQTQDPTPPTFPEMTDFPTIPAIPQDISTTPQASGPTDIPPIITNSKTPKKRGGKLIATILGIFLLIGAVGAGVVLVSQKQLFQQKANIISCDPGQTDCGSVCCTDSHQVCCLTGCKEIADGGCGDTPTTKQCNSAGNTEESCRGQYEGYTYCSCLEGCTTPGCCDGPTNEGFIRVCKAEEATGNNEYRCSDTITNNICQNPHASPSPNPTATPTPTPTPTPPPQCNTVCNTDSQCSNPAFVLTCHTTSSGKYCRNPSCPTKTNCVCPGPTQPPMPIPTLTPNVYKCIGIKAYDAKWNLLTGFSGVVPGDSLYFTVQGSAPSPDTAPTGSFDKAQFKINGVEKTITTNKKPGTDEFYQQYTIPAQCTADSSSSIPVSVLARIHHTVAGWSSY